MNHVVKHIKKISIAIIGGIIVLIGIIAIPYPGPGWLIVFAGLAVLATEFTWAQRLLDRVRGKYEGWKEWLKTQPPAVKATFAVVTCLVVVVTIWLMNGYGILNELLHLHIDWLTSPLAR